jgi:hypothetical protein
MPVDDRPPEPRVIEDADHVREVAEQMKVRPELIEEAVEKVGPNRTAVELWLTAPRA